MKGKNRKENYMRTPNENPQWVEAGIWKMGFRVQVKLTQARTEARGFEFIQNVKMSKRDLAYHHDFIGSRLLWPSSSDIPLPHWRSNICSLQDKKVKSTFQCFLSSVQVKSKALFHHLKFFSWLWDVLRSSIILLNFWECEKCLMDPASAAHPGDWWESWILYVSHSTKTDCFWGGYTIERRGQHWEREIAQCP